MTKISNSTQILMAMVLGDASCAVIVNRMLEGDSIKTS